MKQRFSFLDVRAIVNELQPELVGSYIQNIYSEKRRFVIKFNTNSLLIEPGVRIHLAGEYAHELNGFAKTMRMLRRQKLKSVSQCGFDRIVLLDFGDYRLYAEFFSSGNMIITDASNMTIQLLRTIPGVYERGQVYGVNNAELDLSVALFCSMPLRKFLPVDSLILDDVKRQLEAVLGADLEAFREEVLGSVARDTREEHSPGAEGVEQSLGGLSLGGGPPGRGEELGGRVVEFDRFMAELLARLKAVRDFGGLVLKDGQPNTVLPMEVGADVISRRFGSFNEACQHYFVDRVKAEVSRGVVVEEKQNLRIRELERSIVENREKAGLVEKSPLVAEILKVFQFVGESRMNWEEFFAFKAKEDKKGNEVSLAIKRADFKKERALIVLEGHEVEIATEKNVHYNAAAYYEKAKQGEEKLQKTIKALKKLSKKVKEKRGVVKMDKRKAYWFEKFHFVLLPNKIVLSGRNAQQNEIVVKKFLKTLYFHCTIQGGSSVILEDFNCDVDLAVRVLPEGVARKPAETPDEIRTAAEVALCMSKCWDQRVAHPVFYVGADQVSKTAPAGEYISKGSFLIRGKKSEVDVYKLEYGVGILFRVEGARAADKPQPEEAAEGGERLYFSVDASGKKIVHAMVVTGPWSLLKSFKHRAKLVYGVTKKGKLVKELQTMFDKESRAEENEAIRKIHVDEYMNTIFTNVKLGKF